MVLSNKNFMRKILKREEVWCALNGNADEGMCMGSVPQLLLTNVKGALIKRRKISRMEKRLLLM